MWRPTIEYLLVFSITRKRPSGSVSFFRRLKMRVRISGLTKIICHQIRCFIDGTGSYPCPNNNENILKWLPFVQLLRGTIGIEREQEHRMVRRSFQFLVGISSVQNNMAMCFSRDGNNSQASSGVYFTYGYQVAPHIASWHVQRSCVPQSQALTGR